ncbi:hypothetical protein C6I21_00630 [Alkalicoccus urumqiensis]|uniref:Uncharacterized protein n=1 Tax=Alkalicoccus urumqiensis TaxID=1548213 RepID=A0A2P6MLE2_ALKUR|nr:hypothetical protein C6I21_00630 [Alkalicoccus urumqiensis]
MTKNGGFSAFGTKEYLIGTNGFRFGTRRAAFGTNPLVHGTKLPLSPFRTAVPSTTIRRAKNQAASPDLK